MPAYEAEGFEPPAPVARVSLRNPGTGATWSDVPFLLDSGADVSLIPQAAVTRLGLTIVPDSRYELQSFDGTTSFASVVQLELIFLPPNLSRAVPTERSRIGSAGAQCLEHRAAPLRRPGADVERASRSMTLSPRARLLLVTARSVASCSSTSIRLHLILLWKVGPAVSGVW